MVEIDGTSIISNVIVPGLSRYIILVDDRKRSDRLSAAISGSKNSTSIPKRVNSSSANIRAGPYTESDIRTWSPLERNERNTAIIACLPDGTRAVRQSCHLPSTSDRKSTRLTQATNAHIVCRLLLEKKNHTRHTEIISQTQVKQPRTTYD